MAEYFDILDKNGNKTGEVKSRSLVHRDGDWHRGVRVWIVNSKNEILLQKRSKNKDSNPGKWDISFAGHMESGKEVVETVLREAYEELGISITPAQLKYLGDHHEAADLTNDFIDNMYFDMFLLKLDVPTDHFKIQKEELSEVRFIPYEQLKKMILSDDNSHVVMKGDFDFLQTEMESSAR